jgi:sortase A
MKKLSTLLIIAGLLIILYPSAVRAYDDYQMNKLLSSFEEDIAALEEIDDAQVVDLDYADDYEAMLEEQRVLAANGGSESPNPAEGQTETPTGTPSTVEPTPAPNQPAAAQPAPKPVVKKPKTDTFIKIPAIDLLMPVLKGMTDDNLRYAAATFDNGVVPGGTGNYSLAGHRSYTYGRMFNRLNELAPGHLIEITVKQETFTYRVTESFVVNPEDTWVLKSDKSKNEITLVTCTPIRTATQRLIIKGELVK